MATSGPRTLNGKVVLTVYLLDNSYKTILCEPTSTVHDVCRQMADKIGFSDPEDDSLCFSLNECLDGVTIARPLPGDKEVLSIMEGWYGKPDARFLFLCKLFTDGVITSRDPKVTSLLFIQGVYNIISGTYPTTEKEAVALAALQFQARFGPHNAATHKPGFLSSTLVEFLPAIHLEKGGKTTQQWEEQIFHKHAFSTSTSPRESYLTSLAKRDYYGAALFACKQKFDRTMPRKLFIAISRRGILLVRIPADGSDEEGMETLNSYPLADIYRWAYKPGVNFYFEIKGETSPASSKSGGAEEDNRVYTFETGEGKAMSDLLTDYALALLREMGLNPDGSKRVRPPKPMPKTGNTAAASSSSGSGSGAAAAPAKEAAAAGSSSSPSEGSGPAAPAILPTRAAMATDTSAYKSATGDAATLAVAALRSGEYSEAPAPAPAPAAAGGAPPPPSFSPPPPPPPPPASTLPPPPPPPPSSTAAPAPAAGPSLPANWIECVDDESGDKYYFNQVTGDSVWELEDIPRP